MPLNDRGALGLLSLSDGSVQQESGSIYVWKRGKHTAQRRGPRLSNMNLSVFKAFPVTEKLMLQFRAEAFKFTNSPTFGLPSQAFGSTAPCRFTFD